MKKLTEYINEAYEVNFRDRVQPKTTSELKQIIKDAFRHNRNISKVTDYREMLYECDNATIPSWYKESWYYRTYNK